MSALLKILFELIGSIQTVWSRLSRHIDKNIASLVFIAITVTMIFETLLVSVIIAILVLRLF